MSKFIAVGNWTTPEASWALQRKEIIQVPPERVWRALTEPSELKQWWCDSADVDLRVSGRLAFSGSHVFSRDLVRETPTETPSACSENFEILELEPLERITFRWCLGAAETHVTFTLENQLEHTHLRVNQTSETRLDWPTDDESPNWWWVALPGLRNFLENGNPGLRLDYELVTRDPGVEFEVRLFTFPWVIWQKLCDATELKRWWGPEPVVDPKPGGQFSLGVDVGPREILEIEERARLVHDWHWDANTVGRVEWQIEETDADTRLAVIDHGPWSDDSTAGSLSHERVALHWATTILYLKQMSERGVTPREYQGEI